MPLAVSKFKSTLKGKKFITTENTQKNWLNGSHRTGWKIKTEEELGLRIWKDLGSTEDKHSGVTPQSNVV